MDIFVHETCHLDQQLQRPAWHEHKEDSIEKLDQWLAGKKVKNIESHIHHVIELEWDCEKRSMRKISRNRLPMNLKDYAKMANAYILGYHWILRNREWCKKSYKTTYVWTHMPEKMVSLSEAINPSEELMAPFYE
jgi:hypothetical protein